MLITRTFTRSIGINYIKIFSVCFLLKSGKNQGKLGKLKEFYFEKFVGTLFVQR